MADARIYVVHAAFAGDRHCLCCTMSKPGGIAVSRPAMTAWAMLEFVRRLHCSTCRTGALCVPAPRMIYGLGSMAQAGWILGQQGNPGGSLRCREGYQRSQSGPCSSQPVFMAG